MANSAFFMSPEEYEKIRSRYGRFNEPWTESETEELKSMFEGEVPLAEMANQLQRTPNSVKLRLKSLGLMLPSRAPRPWSEEDNRKVVEGYNEGKGFAEMAEEFGRSESAIVARLVKLRMNLFV